MTPTARTLEYFRKIGIEADICERWMPNPKHPAGGVRKDLFGFLDIVAMDGGIIGVQCTSQGALSAHLKKIREEPRAVKWLENGGHIWVIAWGKRKERVNGKLWYSRWRIAFLDGDKIEFGEALIRD